MPEKITTLPAAVLELYALDPTGVPVGSALYLGVQAANLRLIYRFDEQQTAPTGRKYKRTRVVGESHEIQIDKIWAIGDAGDVTPSRTGRYALVVNFKDPWNDDNDVITRTYYGVTWGSHDVASQDIEFTNGMNLKAEYFVET